MIRRLLSLMLAVSLVLHVPMMVLAHQVKLTKVKDPFSWWTSCEVYNWVSSGSYIYNWLSKYDAVYWPHTDARWIWVCDNSGYVSFGDDFSELSNTEKKNISAYLDGQSRKVTSSSPISEKLRVLEETYRLREKDHAFWAWFYRILAYWNKHDTQVANDYRQRALGFVEMDLPNLKEGQDIIQAYYIIGEYSRILGNQEKAKTFFTRARTHEWIDENGEAQVGDPYWDAIIQEREKLR